MTFPLYSPPGLLEMNPSHTGWKRSGRSISACLLHRCLPPIYYRLWLLLYYCLWLQPPYRPLLITHYLKKCSLVGQRARLCAQPIPSWFEVALPIDDSMFDGSNLRLWEIVVGVIDFNHLHKFYWLRGCFVSVVSLLWWLLDALLGCGGQWANVCPGPMCVSADRFLSDGYVTDRNVSPTNVCPARPICSSRCPCVCPAAPPWPALSCVYW